jgi:hypothetical protein
MSERDKSAHELYELQLFVWHRTLTNEARAYNTHNQGLWDAMKGGKTPLEKEWIDAKAALVRRLPPTYFDALFFRMSTVLSGLSTFGIFLEISHYRTCSRY